MLNDLPALKLAARAGHCSTTSLRDLLAREPVCRDIVDYLMRNTDAADTARGIAEWWIRRDLAATQDALMKLQACDVVQSYIVQDNIFVYAYTKRAVLRQSLARHLQATSAPRAATGR